jgi:hypothetical protein
MKAASNPNKGGGEKPESSIEATAAEATAALEEAAAGTVRRLAEMSRNVQAAAFDETRAAALAFENLLKARSLPDAAQNYFDYLRSRADVSAARAKSAVTFMADAARDVLGPGAAK